MELQYSKPFIEATVLVCHRVLELQIFPKTPSAVHSFAPKHFVTGTLSVHGDLDGTIAFGMDRVFALRATQLLMRHKANGVDATVVDVVGELTNQIAGAARSRMNSVKLDVSFPEVICGVSKPIPFPLNAKRVTYPFSSLWGDISVDFGFSSQDAPLRSAKAYSYR